MRSRDLNRLTEGPGGDVRLHTTLPGTQDKGGPGFILEFTIKVHGNLGHDKAQTHFVYFSPSKIPILVKLSTYGKLRSRRIQRRWLQEVWWRTHRGRRVLPKDQSISLDKDY